MKTAILPALCLVVVLSTSLPITSLSVSSVPATQATVDKYDPKRDPGKDIQDAIIEAGKTSKRILLEVGGEWCVWCHIMDRYFEENPKLLEFREKNFVMVKINFSRENENKKLLSRYPAIPGYPHIFVLDSNGKLLHSQDTSKLESGKSYNLEKFFSFLQKWARS